MNEKISQLTAAPRLPEGNDIIEVSMEDISAPTGYSTVKVKLSDLLKNTYDEEHLAFTGSVINLAHPVNVFYGIYRNGVRLRYSEYTRVGTAITLTIAAVSEDFAIVYF